jgi:EPS-associated MarR family transcriptional regulator
MQGEAERIRLTAMRLLAQQPSLNQRELARAMGMSLGKTNYLLRELLDKGWIKVQNFRRSDHKLAYAYLLTPSGIRQKVALTRRFLSRKESEFEMLQRVIGDLRAELERQHSEQANLS